MILGVYSVYDSKSCCFGVPNFILTDGLAKRGFSDVVNDPSSVISRHPSDFILYKVADFDDSGAIFTPIAPVLSLGNAAEYKRDKVPTELARSLASVVQLDLTNGTEEVSK